MNWEEILMDAGIAAIVVSIIGVIGGLIKVIYDSKKGTDRLQQDHTELKNGQGTIKEVIKESIMNVLSELKFNTSAINNVDKILAESKVNQRRDFESLSKDQKELKEHMDKFQNLLNDWERQANVIIELEHLKQQLMEKNNKLEKQIYSISEEMQKLGKENAVLKEKINSMEYVSGRMDMKDVSDKIEKLRNENKSESLKHMHRGRDRER